MNSNQTARLEVTIDTEIARLAGISATASERVASMKRYKKDGDRDLLEAIDAAASTREAFLAENKKFAGWSRFFLVNNKGGHIHSSTSCSTCTFRTSFSWLTNLAAMTSAEAVEEFGAILCSVCFPEAPVEWTNGKNKKVEADKQLAADLKAMRATPEGKKLLKADRDLRSTASSAKWACEAVAQLEGFAADGQERTPERVASLRSDIVAALAKQIKTEALLVGAQSKLDLASLAFDVAAAG
tara:strand:- start:1430 stop:2155 length:726 start_codon:yes stop_codon:yes gene_type:complete